MAQYAIGKTALAPCDCRCQLPRLRHGYDLDAAILQRLNHAGRAIAIDSDCQQLAGRGDGTDDLGDTVYITAATIEQGQLAGRNIVIVVVHRPALSVALPADPLL